MSVAGGIDKAPARAQAEGCEIFQCFTRPPQGGPAPKLTPLIIANFKSAMKEFGMENFYIHTPYYLNFASLKSAIREASIRVCREELERGSMLGAKYVMTHLGSSAGQTPEGGIEKVTAAVQKILTGYQGATELLLEISAGAGNIIGDKFEEIGAIVSQAKNFSGFGGVCFDTCHAFASGYDFRTPVGLRSVLKEFDEEIGLKWLKLVHVNDSKFDLGQKKDRHEHIGRGFIGEEGIAALLSTPTFAALDWILETETEGRKADIKTLKKIRGVNLTSL